MPFRFYCGRAVRLLGFVLTMSPAVATAQPVTSFEFSFSNPGARSMGFGGAFVALADDATAAFANPAGLIQLTRPEISAEGRSWSYTTPFTRGGRAAGQPTGIGIDTAAGPLIGESEGDWSGLSFASLVYPRKPFAFALFQHQLMDFEFSLETQGLFGPGSVFAGSVRRDIQTLIMDLEVVTRGLAVAFRAHDKLSLGLTLSYFEPSVTLDGRSYLPDEDTMESYFAESTFRPERLIQTNTFFDAAGDWGFAGGFLWSLSDQWKLGGVYREGPDFEIGFLFELGPAHDVAPGRFREGRSPLAFPDVFGLGVSFRSQNGRWTAGFEWDRVEYSVILESFGPGIIFEGEFIDDGDEFHLGGEYVFLGSKPVFAVRLGVWLDPDHRVRTTEENPFIRANDLPGEDELHFAAGLGVAFQRFQIDLGIDRSELIDRASLSAIYSF